jgi:hypothetical protein
MTRWNAIERIFVEVPPVDFAARLMNAERRAGRTRAPARVSRALDTANCLGGTLIKKVAHAALAIAMRRDWGLTRVYARCAV